MRVRVGLDARPTVGRAFDRIGVPTIYKETTMTKPRTYEEAKRAGWVCVGEWGYGDSIRGTGAVWCRPEDRDATQAAYDAIADGDLGPDVLADVFDAGGVFIREQE